MNALMYVLALIASGAGARHRTSALCCVASAAVRVVVGASAFAAFPLFEGRRAGAPRACVGRGDARLALCRPFPPVNMIIPVRCFTCGKVIGT